jgi:hypothetical protein
MKSQLSNEISSLNDELKRVKESNEKNLNDANKYKNENISLTMNIDELNKTIYQLNEDLNNHKQVFLVKEFDSIFAFS